MVQQERCLRRKRSRDHTAADDELNLQKPKAKRRKTSVHNYPPQVWDALSKVTLTRKALREFDRRTEGRTPCGTPGSPEQRATRALRPKSHRLARFADLGGPNLSDLRGYAEFANTAAAMSPSSSRSGKRSRHSGRASSKATTKTTRTSTTGPYDPQFEQMLIDVGVYPDGHRTKDGGRPPKPGNIDELRERLSRSRASLSPTAFPESAFEDFQDLNRRAKSEAKAMSRLVPTITGAADNECESEENVQFTNLEKFDNNLKAPNPDIYYGTRPIHLNERIRADLDAYLVPSTRTNLPVAPSFFLECKSTSGRFDVAQRQAMYDGAVGARAILKLQNYGDATVSYDGNAYSLTAVYHAGMGSLVMYATHPSQTTSAGGAEYYMTRLRGYDMASDSNGFRSGATAFRNARDLSQEFRDRFIAKANDVAQSMPAATGSQVT